MRFLTALAVVVAVAARGAVFLWWEQASFDSDQAVTGLMAKHLSEGRAFPLFFYGQNYLLAVQAWMAAPVFLVLGPTVAALKLPLWCLNAVTALLLVRVLCEDVGLRPAAALLASAFFVLAPPGTAGQLMSALGVSVEPFLYVLLIWMLRERPIAQGLVLGIGFLHREFTAYGFAGVLAVAALDRSLFTRARARRVAAALATAAAVWAVVWALRPYSSGAGPGTTPLDVAGASNNIQGLARPRVRGTAADCPRIRFAAGILSGRAPRADAVAALRLLRELTPLAGRAVGMADRGTHRTRRDAQSGLARQPARCRRLDGGWWARRSTCFSSAPSRRPPTTSGGAATSTC